MKNDYIKSCIERAKLHNKCPKCNEELTTVINGEIWGDRVVKLKKIIAEYDLKIEMFGVIYGDDRDFDYICRNCGGVYNCMLRSIDGEANK